jgi:septum site-determining protein MinC
MADGKVTGSMNKTISIRGTREGLTITLGMGDAEGILSALSQHLGSQGAFFRGGLVALETDAYALGIEVLASIGQLLGQHEMVLRTVVSANAATRAAAQSLGLRVVTRAPGGEPAETAETPRATVPASPSPTAEGTRGVLVRRRIRSGQAVRHTGHVVVIGDVSAGAELSAGGDIVVWGKLMGTAHAGAMGDDSAVVCALELNPLQLRIGHLVARPAEGDQERPKHPEVAYVRDNMIVVDNWDRARRGA